MKGPPQAENFANLRHPSDGFPLENCIFEGKIRRKSQKFPPAAGLQRNGKYALRLSMIFFIIALRGIAAIILIRKLVCIVVRNPIRDVNALLLNRILGLFVQGNFNLSL